MYMLLFSKQAKYITYTFVIKVLNKKKKYLKREGIQFTKSAMITVRGGLANTSCKSANLHKIQIANFHKCFDSFHIQLCSSHIRTNILSIRV